MMLSRFFDKVSDFALFWRDHCSKYLDIILPHILNILQVKLSDEVNATADFVSEVASQQIYFSGDMTEFDLLNKTEGSIMLFSPYNEFL